MAMDYNDLPRRKGASLRESLALEEEERLKWESYEEEPFDETILTSLQRMEVDELEKENPLLTRRDLAMLIRINLVSYRASLEGREPTVYEIMDAEQLKEVIYWVPPTQLEGINDLTFDLCDYEVSCLPCDEHVTSEFDSFVLINECLDLICETRRLDDLRVEKLARDYAEACFDKNYLCTSVDLESDFLMLEESRSLLELADIGNELDVDKILNEIENPEVEKNYENVDIVFYMIDGDKVDYFVKTSFKHVVDFIFPSNAFDPHEHPLIKEYLMTYAMLVVIFFDENCVSLSWKAMYSWVHFVYCSSRRRTKGALAQPFDSHD